MIHFVHYRHWLEKGRGYVVCEKQGGRCFLLFKLYHVKDYGL